MIGAFPLLGAFFTVAFFPGAFYVSAFFPGAFYMSAFFPGAFFASAFSEYDRNFLSKFILYYDGLRFGLPLKRRGTRI